MRWILVKQILGPHQVRIQIWNLFPFKSSVSPDSWRRCWFSKVVSTDENIGFWTVLVSTDRILVPLSLSLVKWACRMHGLARFPLDRFIYYENFIVKPGTDEQFFFDKFFLDKFYLFVCMGKLPVSSLIQDWNSSFSIQTNK